MSLAAAIAGVVAGLGIGIFGGLKVGEMIRGRARTYWILSGVAVLVCMALDFVGLATGQLWLALGSIGLMGGSITGLKYGYSESIGIWRTIDTWTGSDAALRPADEDDDAPSDRDVPQA
jgi:hypothetical protein